MDLKSVKLFSEQKHDVVGYGDDYSQKNTTTTKNYYVRVTTTPVNGGADVVIEGLNHLIFPDGEDKTTLHLRKHARPRIGQELMIQGKFVKVKAKRFNNTGRIEVLDEYTGTWFVYEE